MKTSLKIILSEKQWNQFERVQIIGTVFIKSCLCKKSRELMTLMFSLIILSGFNNTKSSRMKINKENKPGFNLSLKINNIKDVNQNSMDIKEFRWVYRIICIEAIDKKEAVQQLASFNKLKKENVERKLKFFVKVSNAFFEGLEMNQVADIKNFPIKLKSQKFSIILIGLDGGIKNRWHEQVNATEIYGKIDAMPMRMGENKDL